MFALEDRYWWFVARRRLALRLIRKFGPPQGQALDVGCGTGAMLQILGQSYQAHGLDVSQEALDYCRSRGLDAVTLGSAESLPYAENSFDLVVTLDTLEHVEDHVAAAREIARVLRPGAVVVVNVPAFRWLWGPHDVALHHHRRYTSREAEQLLSEAGLEVVFRSYSVFALFPLVAVRRWLERRWKGPAEVRLPAVSDPVNRLLIGLMEAEGALLERLPLPWGSSVVLVARKPTR